LARAGKVRAQTPKVEKQEHKKKKRGRAFRRIQYNRDYLCLNYFILMNIQVALPMLLLLARDAVEALTPTLPKRMVVS